MALILAIAAVLLFSQNAAAPPTYAATVDQYISGDANRALRQLASPAARLPAGVFAQAKQFPDLQVRAAVMMHTASSSPTATTPPAG